MPTADARFRYDPDGGGDVDVDFITAVGAKAELQTAAELIESPGFDGADVKLRPKRAVPFRYRVTAVGDAATDVQTIIDATLTAQGEIGTFFASISIPISILNVALLDVRPGPIRGVGGTGFAFLAEIDLTLAQVK